MKKNSVKKVALDMYIEQMKWSVWFIGIIMAVYIGFNIAANFFDLDFIDNLLGFSEGSSIIYMFVIGIIAGLAFLPQFIKLGVTRRHVFYGTVISAILVSVSLPLIFSLFTGVEYLLSRLFGFTIEGPLFRNFIASFFLYSLNNLMGYLAGWLINVGFYKFNWKAGLLFIALAGGVIALYTLIWKDSIISLYSTDLGTLGTGLPLLLSLLKTLALILFVLITIRTLTKRISIKIK
jgi:hypothetical protein